MSNYLYKKFHILLDIFFKLFRINLFDIFFYKINFEDLLKLFVIFENPVIYETFFIIYLLLKNKTIFILKCQKNQLIV